MSKPKTPFTRTEHVTRGGLIGVSNVDDAQTNAFFAQGIGFFRRAATIAELRVDRPEIGGWDARSLPGCRTVSSRIARSAVT